MSKTGKEMWDTDRLVGATILETPSSYGFLAEKDGQKFNVYAELDWGYSSCSCSCSPHIEFSYKEVSE